MGVLVNLKMFRFAQYKWNLCVQPWNSAMSLACCILEFVLNLFLSSAIPIAIPHYIISASSLQQSGQTLAQFVMWWASISSTHPAPHTVITLLLTLLQVLWFTWLCLTCNQGVLLYHFSLFIQAPKSGSMSVSILLYFIFFIGFHIQLRSHGISISLSGFFYSI